MSHFDTVADVLLSVAFAVGGLYFFVRLGRQDRCLRRFGRRLDLHEEAERISNLPLEQLGERPEQHRRPHLRLVPVFAGMAASLAWLKARPSMAAISLAAVSTALVTAVMVPAVSRDITADQPSVAVPLSSTFMRPSTKPASPPLPTASATASVTPTAAPAAPSTASRADKIVLPKLPSLPTLTLPSVPKTLISLPTSTATQPTTTQPTPILPEPEHAKPKHDDDPKCPLVDLQLLLSELCSH